MIRPSRSCKASFSLRTKWWSSQSLFNRPFFYYFFIKIPRKDDVMHIHCRHLLDWSLQRQTSALLLSDLQTSRCQFQFTHVSSSLELWRHLQAETRITALSVKRWMWCWWTWWPPSSFLQIHHFDFVLIFFSCHLSLNFSTTQHISPK